MSLLKGAFVGATVLASVLAAAAAAQAASVNGIAPKAPAANVAPFAEKVHGYHRRCRWSNRWGSHRHWRGRVRHCDGGPGVGFSFGYYYGPYLYWGPPLRSYRGHHRGRRVEGRRHRRGHIIGNRLPGFVAGPSRQLRGDRGRFERNRQLRQLRGNTKRQLRRKRSDLPATVATTSFGGWPAEIGGLPARLA